MFLVFLLVLPIVGCLVAGIGGIYKAYVWPRKLAAVQSLASVAVAAAEAEGQRLGLSGRTKYDYAVTVLDRLSVRVGVNLKAEEAHAFIHAVLNDNS